MIKSKTLITMAVASTFGLSAAAFAGNGHEVVTPFSPNEFGNVSITQELLQKSEHMTSIGSTSSHAGGTVTGSSESFGSLEPSASGESSMDWMALGDQGIYSDYYLVSLTPELGDQWEYYLIDVDPEQLSFSEETYFLMPTYDVVLIEDMGQDVASDLGE